MCFFLNRSEDKQEEGVWFVCVWSEYLPWKVDRCATKLWESLSSHVTEMCAAFVLWCQQCFHLPRVWECVCRRSSAGRRVRCVWMSIAFSVVISLRVFVWGFVYCQGCCCFHLSPVRISLTWCHGQGMMWSRTQTHQRWTDGADV